MRAFTERAVELASEAARLLKKGIGRPFVFCDLKLFLPPWAQDGKPDEPASDDEDACKLVHKHSKNLDIVRWQAASVALRAPLAEVPRKSMLGVIYDETARKLWKQRSFSGECGFDVNVVAKTFDPAVLRQAEATYDAFRSSAAGAKGLGKSKSKVQCYKCGGFGHVATDCKMDNKGKGGGKGNKDKQCYKCGRVGHLAADCRQRLKRSADGSAKTW